MIDFSVIRGKYHGAQIPQKFPFLPLLVITDVAKVSTEDRLNNYKYVLLHKP